jgi:hypothetical protein
MVRGTVYRLYIGRGGFWVCLSPRYAACDLVTYLRSRGLAVMVVILSPDGLARVTL